MTFPRFTPSTSRRLSVAAWLAATVLVALLVSRVDVSRFAHATAAADVRWLAAAVASNLLIQPLGALQWHALLPPGVAVTRRRLLRLFSLTSVANNTTPSLVGHVTGAVLLAAEPGVGTAVAVSTLVLDQVAVGLAKVGILVAASVLLQLPAWVHDGLVALVVVVAVIILVTLLVARRTTHLAALREPRRLATGTAIAIAVKLAEAGAIGCVMQAFGSPFRADTVLMVLAATALAGVVPLSPAGIGSYEAAAYAAYRYQGFAPETALGIAVVQHACQLLPAIGAGFLLLAAPRALRASPS